MSRKDKTRFPATLAPANDAGRRPCNLETILLVLYGPGNL